MLKMIKQKRAYVFAAVISLSLAVALLFFMASRGATKPSLKIAEGFGTYNDLIDHSPIVITATVTSENKEFDYAEMTFAITAVEPIDIVRGDVNAKNIANHADIFRRRSLFEKGYSSFIIPFGI